MLGTPRILTFAFRAAVLLLLVPLAWIAVAERYNELLVTLSQRLVFDASLNVVGRHILVTVDGQPDSLSLDGFTLHYGLLLLIVLVLAAVGIGAGARIRWLAGLSASAIVLHVIGLAALTQGIAWTASDGTPGTFVFRSFAVFWGLVPAAIGGAWCFLYWLPRASQPAERAQVEAVS